ncbi:DNA polymerase III subunit gamma/tau, partial [Rhodobacterales bacterium HKCCE3408]|nr:DNA polymerase III subunit gamma/tau [Rhodobacterales bacterium HKCCE3408]
PDPAPRGPRGSALPQAAAEPALAHYPTFEHVMRLMEANRAIRLLVEVRAGVRLVSYTPGRIAFTPAETAPPDLAQRLQQSLSGWTGVRWIVTVEGGGTAPTWDEAEAAAQDALAEAAEAHPLMQAVRAAFPQAKITAIRSREAMEQEAGADALPEADDEWDPFEDD